MSESRLVEVLNDQQANYILPFLWQRGESEAVIREEMGRVHAAGIGAVCVEARPHPDFLGPRWWADFDVIMEEARQRGMHVWVLDDDHFPTGHANGKLVGAPAGLRRQFLREAHVDAIGPCSNAAFPIQPWFNDPFTPGFPEGTELLAAIAARRDLATNALSGESIDISDTVKDGVFYWDIPDGYWRVFLLILSPTGGSEGQVDYLNPLVPESTRVLLDAVYEPFYQRYPADFGQTFAGFFSDEPGFYNDKQSFDYNSSLGKKGVALPWRAGLLDILAESFGSDYRKYLPMLWHDCGESSAPVRYTYMNVVSKLYGEHFTGQIGDWCRARNVEYIGHVLEDNGVHARLGPGAGHYFRALWGQDMAGLDVVLWQLAPGFDAGTFANPSGEADGEFYHYGLAKMGSSLAHLDPKKKGRAMCEVFGAYGWREGLKLMKWMTDHMLVRGVNYFIPHAFSQAEFPDPDCPPHMYARGKNPQYRYYRELNLYTNRLSHLLSGGRHVACAAVLYHAEAEWSGKFMPFQAPVRALMQNQVDCDVLPGDILLGGASIVDGRLQVEAETYGCLVIPMSEALPADLIQRLDEFAGQGLLLLFIDGFPTLSCERRDVREALNHLDTHHNVRCVPLAELAGMVRSLGLNEIEVDSYKPSLRYYHVAYPDSDVFMFFNEHPYQPIEARVRIPGNGRVLSYDAFKNQLFECGYIAEQNQLQIPLRLSPYESTLLVTGKSLESLPGKELPRPGVKAQLLSGPWGISTATADQYPAFEAWKQVDEPFDLSGPDALPVFSGTFRYETSFTWSQPARTVLLDLGEAYEIAEVWINGQAAGLCICPPYRYEIGEFLLSGENSLVIEVTNTLVKEQRDFFSRFAPEEPSGLLGPVRLLY